MIQPIEFVHFLDFEQNLMMYHLMNVCSHWECYRATGVTRDRGKALRVIPRGKQRLTVYRAPQVTRRAFLRSESNTATGENDS